VSGEVWGGRRSRIVRAPEMIKVSQVSLNMLLSVRWSARRARYRLRCQLLMPYDGVAHDACLGPRLTSRTLITTRDVGSNRPRCSSKRSSNLGSS